LVIHNGLMLIIIPSFYAVIVMCYVKIRRSINAIKLAKVREYNRSVSAALAFQVYIGRTGILMLGPDFCDQSDTVLSGPVL
jgi:hypothetical protein